MKTCSKNRIQQSGFSLVELLVVVVTVGIVSAIAIPNLLATKRLTNEASAIQSLRVIGMSEHLYQSSMGGGNFGTLSQLGNAGFINTALSSTGRKDRYLFAITTTARTATALPTFVATARPQNHVLSQPVLGAGTRDFGTNELGAMYQTDNGTVVTFNPTTRLPTGSTVPLKSTAGSGAQD